MLTAGQVARWPANWTTAPIQDVDFLELGMGRIRGGCRQRSGRVIDLLSSTPAYPEPAPQVPGLPSIAPENGSRVFDKARSGFVAGPQALASLHKRGHQ